jgi:hypothetical protein
MWASVSLRVSGEGPIRIGSCSRIEILNTVLGGGLILHVDYSFEQLPEVLRKLPREGLFLAISNLRIRSDEEFREFVSAQWNC